MTPLQYQIDASRTDPSDYGPINERLANPEIAHLLHAAIGMVTEAGEFIDQLKKHIYYGKPLDKKNLKEELGDQMWYVAKGCNSLDEELGVIMYLNIEKLKLRFPDKFTDQHAINRDPTKEMEVYDK